MSQNSSFEQLYAMLFIFGLACLPWVGLWIGYKILKHVYGAVVMYTSRQWRNVNFNKRR